MNIYIVTALTVGIMCNMYGTSTQALPWEELSVAIVRGNLDTVKDIVPSKIKPNQQNEHGLTPIGIANNAKKRFDEVATYIQTQIKEEGTRQKEKEEGTRGWTSAHAAASRALEDFVKSVVDGNEPKAKKDLGQALKQVETIVNAAENMQAKSPSTKQTLRQQLNLVEEIVGKQEAFGENMAKLHGYLYAPAMAPARPATPTGDDWHELRDGLDNGALFMVKAVVPSKIKPNDKMPDGQEIKTVAFFHKRRHDQIAMYLQQQLKDEAEGQK